MGLIILLGLWVVVVVVVAQVCGDPLVLLPQPLFQLGHLALEAPDAAVQGEHLATTR